MVQLPPNAPKSSFGIPDDMRQQMEAQRTEKEAQERLKEEADQDPMPPVVEDDMGLDLSDREKFKKKLDPEEILKEIGIELTDDDLHGFIFLGRLQKTVAVVKVKNHELTAGIRLITGEEYDEADELLAEEVLSTKMTVDGRDTRKNMWQLAFAVEMLNGKHLVKPAVDGEKVDRKEVARKKKAILNKLTPAVLSRLMVVYARFTLACNLMVENPDNPLFKEPLAQPEGTVAAN